LTLSIHSLDNSLWPVSFFGLLKLPSSQCTTVQLYAAFICLYGIKVPYHR
jgi:hypothetical protein